MLSKIPKNIYNFKINEEWDNKPNIQLTDSSGVSQSLDEVQQIIEDEVLREQNQKHQFVHSNLLYINNKYIIYIVIIYQYIIGTDRSRIYLGDS